MTQGATEDITLSTSIRPPSRPGYAVPGFCLGLRSQPVAPSSAPTPPLCSSLSRQQVIAPQKAQEKNPRRTEEHTPTVAYHLEHVLRRTDPRVRQKHRGRKIAPCCRIRTQNVLPPLRSQRNSRLPAGGKQVILHPSQLLYPRAPCATTSGKADQRGANY